MLPSRPCLRLLCPHLLLFLAELAGCGPASSDHALSVEWHASVSKPPLSDPGTAAGINPQSSATSAANPGALASENETGAVDDLVGPVWMEELASPNIPLETGAQLEPRGGVDPLIQALNDEDVVAKELIEEQENQDGDERQGHQPHDEEGEK